jgi:hypothetical protein
LARVCINATSWRSSSRVGSPVWWQNIENIGAPAPSSMPPLGSITHNRTRPVLTCGASRAISDHSTEPLPAPVAPAIRMCWPKTGSCHQVRISVIPTRTAARLTVVARVGMGKLMGWASTSPRLMMMRSSPGVAARIVSRSARHAAASAGPRLCQSVIDWPATTRTMSTSA